MLLLDCIGFAGRHLNLVICTISKSLKTATYLNARARLDGRYALNIQAPDDSPYGA